jgi:uncharacterized OsmC-like protein
MRTFLPSQLSPPTRGIEAALRARYDSAPASAWVTHLAWTEASNVTDAHRGAVRVGLEGRELSLSLERAVGGPNDDMRPRDLFCAAIAACFDSSIRLVAARQGVALERLVVIVTGDVDARGVLGDPDVPVGFQSMRIEVQLRVRGGSAGRLLATAEQHCVLLQTLGTVVPMEIVIGDPID